MGTIELLYRCSKQTSPWKGFHVNSLGGRAVFSNTDKPVQFTVRFVGALSDMMAQTPSNELTLISMLR